MTENNWYVIYTRSRFEKKVKLKLDEKSIETYLPMWKEISQWSDRKKLVEVPIFKGYLFVKINLHTEQIKVLDTPGVVNFIYFNGRISKLSPRDYKLIKLLSEDEEVEHIKKVKDFVMGERVQITKGALKGVEGFVNKISKKVIQIYFESIKQSIFIQIKPEYLEKIGK